MIVMQLLGGLGNQMFQYACGRALALRTGKKLYLDVRHYGTDSQRRYELDSLNIQAGLLYSLEDMKQAGISAGIQGLSVWKERYFTFDPAVVSLQDNVFLTEGYWQSPHYFQDAKARITKELTPRLPSLSMETLNLAMEMDLGSAVGIHVRRGDYVEKSTYHGVLPMDYYQRAIHYIMEKVSDVRFYLFSDDIEWCKEQFASLPFSQVVEHTRNKGSQEDLWLMSRCSHNIIANSTYSWWGAWLNNNPNKIVIAPEPWFADLSQDTSQLLPKGWITLPVAYQQGQEMDHIFSQMKKPKVSICIPAFRQPSLLKRCLQSIHIQTFTDYEVIITDDSLDNCLESVISEFSSVLPLRYIKNETQLGSPENWNCAMSYARGEYIKIIHHDDWLYNEHSLGIFVEMLDQNPKAILAFCSSRHYEHGLHTSSHTPPTEQIAIVPSDPNGLFLANIIGAPSAVIFRRCAVLFDKQLKWVVDLDFYIRLLRVEPNLVYTKQELICIDAINDTKMTTICEHSKTINLFEYFYLFNKLKINSFTEPYINFFLRLFLKYDVNSLEEIHQCGYTGPLDVKFEKILMIKKLLKELER